jgi:hypothetical protein
MPSWLTNKANAFDELHELGKFDELININGI